MKKYKTILFDIDDTLLDFKENERSSLINTFKQLNCDFNETIKKKYIEINRKLWEQHEQDIIPREMIFKTRFPLLFKELNIEIDGIKAEEIYRENLSKGAQLIENAKEVCLKLSNNYDLYVVTNGFGKTQYDRLKKSELDKFFKGVFISEEVGFQKPNKKFFEYIFNKIQNIELDKTIIIGDSLTTDIQGGINANIDTCWFNRYMKENNTDIIATYEIHKLEEIYEILK